MSKYGCIGNSAAFSLTKEIHAKLADYEYELIQLNEEEIALFLQDREFSAVNLAPPYAQAVIPFLDQVSEIAAKIGHVDTIVNRNGKLCGYNTSYYGMQSLIVHVGIDVSGKKVLVLGTGCNGRTAQVLAKDMGASEIVAVCIPELAACTAGQELFAEHFDANIIINTISSGMCSEYNDYFPDIGQFSQLDGVIDICFDPLYTNLILDAKERGICGEGGLYMLVMQSVLSAELFTGGSITKEIADRVFVGIISSRENIVLTGMPGSGKSKIGKSLDLPGLEFIDTDEEVEKLCGCTIKELMAEKGEPYFRDLESKVIREISRRNGMIISTGGGAILRRENVRCLKQNGKLFFIDADISRLQVTDSRPLSDTPEKLRKLYTERIGIYRNTADVIISDLKNAEEEVAYIRAMHKARMQ